ncbi:polysaccharide deacetylase [Tissierella creatinini]|nr:polysaccharide deacetylase [Tissierella creatinini]TJX66725.1 polysaccharide deacetylase [Soehngenia saccharolytica]
MRNDKRIRRKKIELMIISLLTMTIVIGGFSINNKNNSNVVEAINIVYALSLLNDENPINKAIDNRITEIKIKNAEVELNNRRRELKAEKLVQAREEEELKVDKLAEAKANGKIAYLTFDDGPSKVVTPHILEVLEQNDVKATFFVIGYMAEKYPEVVRMTYKDGHAIGNHTYSHNYGYIYKSSANFLEDIERANMTLKLILGEDFSTNVIRFPGGSFGQNKKAAVNAIKESGYYYFDWNSLNGDAEGVDLTKDRLIERFTETIQNKGELIVLMHDTDMKNSTVQALPEIIKILKDKGYIFGVLDEYYE